MLYSTNWSGSDLTLQARGGGGAQSLEWPNPQLPIRNLLLYDAQTWWLLVLSLRHVLTKF